jgi:uncharacterized protein
VAETTASHRHAESEHYRQLAGEFMSELTSGTIELGEWFTDDVEFVVADADHGETTAAIPWAGRPFTGIAGVDEVMRYLGRNFDMHSLPVDHIIADGPDVVVLGRFHFTARSTGRTLTSPWAAHLVFRGDKVARYHFYENTFAVARSFRTGDPWNVDNDDRPRQLAT